MIKKISLPLHSSDISDLGIGDILYISGLVYTGRDDVHRRVVIERQALPVSLEGGAIFHAGPITEKKGDAYNIVAVGPTTSMRMENHEAEFLAESGVKLIIGKGGMGKKTEKACVQLGAIHTVYPGGCAALAATQVEAVEGVYWPDLGMSEAMWALRVREAGPLVVSIDTRGNNLFENNKLVFNRRKENLLSKRLFSFSWNAASGALQFPQD